MILFLLLTVFFLGVVTQFDDIESGDVGMSVFISFLITLTISFFGSLSKDYIDIQTAPTWTLRSEQVDKVYNIVECSDLNINPATGKAYFLYTDGVQTLTKDIDSEDELVYYNTEKEGRTDAFVVEQRYYQKPYVLLWRLWAGKSIRHILFLPEWMKR